MEANPALKEIRQALEQARDRLDFALRSLGQSPERQSMRWRCLGCGYLKHFTRPQPAHVAPPCPKCDGKTFEAMP